MSRGGGTEQNRTRKGKTFQRTAAGRKIFKTTKGGYLGGSKEETKITENGDH